MTRRESSTRDAGVADLRSKLTIDFEAGAAYVYLPGYGPDCPVHPRWSEQVAPHIIVDYLCDTEAIGVEVLNLQAEIPIVRLVKDWNVPDETIRLLLTIASASVSTS